MTVNTRLHLSTFPVPLARLGPDRFAVLMAEGAALTPPEAVALAFESSYRPDVAKDDAGAIRALLSPREREVLRLVPGRTDREIGDVLFISESTVRTHIVHILDKLGLRNQKELVALIYEKELLK